MENIAEKLQNTLKELKERVPGVEAVIALSEEGFPLASISGVNEDTLGAMALLTMETAKRVGSELREMVVDEIIIRGNKGHVVVMKDKSERCLAVLAGVDAKTGVLLYEMRKTLSQIGELLKT